MTRLAELRRLDAEAADVAAAELAAAAAADRESALRAQLDDARTSFEADLRATKAEAMRSASDAYDATARAETALVALEAAQERENELRALLDPATNPRSTRESGVAEGTPAPADPKPAEDASTSARPARRRRRRWRRRSPLRSRPLASARGSSGSSSRT